MQKFTFFYGNQAYEFERPEIAATTGANAEIAGKIYTLILKPSTTKAVVKCST